MTRVIRAADLFCGAGGTSLGLGRACENLGAAVDLVAVNHWPKAVSTHELNHPWATHYCASMGSLDPLRAVPGGELDLIVAGVECTHHSRARGGKPKSDQSRASAWHVAHWAEKLKVQHILIENVPEFRDWGPLDENGKAIPDLKGATFRAFVAVLESMAYRVEWRILNCADFGDPTTRRRFFLQARLGGGEIAWPDPTHSKDQESGLEPWRTAREVIDWSDIGTSIFSRKRPLADRTLERIKQGIRKFCGDYADAFLVMFYGTNDARSVDLPVPTVTAGGNHIGVAQPFLVRYFGNSGAEGVGDPLSTVATQNKKKNGLSLVDSVHEPMRTITASNGGDCYVVSPFMVPNFGERPTQEPRTHSIDAPVPTVTASKGAGNLVAPFLVPYYRTGVPKSVDEPVGTITTRDRFALVTPEGHALDIYFRMLKPEELARAQGFPDSYRFVGNKRDTVRQIGNAVPVSTAQKLCAAILDRAA